MAIHGAMNLLVGPLGLSQALIATAVASSKQNGCLPALRTSSDSGQQFLTSKRKEFGIKRDPRTPRTNTGVGEFPVKETQTWNRRWGPGPVLFSPCDSGMLPSFPKIILAFVS